jgi:hypothetical protein
MFGVVSSIVDGLDQSDQLGAHRFDRLRPRSMIATASGHA